MAELADQITDLRKRLGRDVYDWLPGHMWKRSNILISIMAELEEIAQVVEMLEGQSNVTPLRSNASPAEVREHLKAYRGGKGK